MPVSPTEHPCRLPPLKSTDPHSPSDFLSQSQSHITTDGQSVCLSWCRAPSGAHNQILVTICQLLSCPLGAPSLTRGRVCHVLGSVDSNKSIIRIYKYLHFTCFTLQEYIIYKASVSPGKVQQIMPYF
jgi:hypothetical protein